MATAIQQKLEEKAKQADEAILKLAAAQQQPPATAPATTAVTEPAATPTTPPPETQEQTPQPAAETVTPTEPPQEPAVTEPAQEPTPEQVSTSAALDERLKKLEASYRSLQGKYNAELPAAAARVRELSDENRTLLKVIADLRQGNDDAAKAQAEQGAWNGQQANGDGLTKEREELLRQTLGDQAADALLSLLPKAANNTELQKRFDELTQRFERVSYDTFIQQLTALCPDWESLNNDPGFLQWLSEKDTFSGVSRHALLKAAEEKDRDAVRVAHFFRAYAEQNKQPEPVAAPTKQVVRTPSLASQQTPKKAAGTPPPPPTPKVYTRAEYQALMQQACHLQKSDPKRAQAQIDELDRAIQEKRVR